MANRYTIGSGNASNPAVWDGGATVPGTGDRVLIMAAHTITLDGTYTWGDDTTSTITINGVSTTAGVTLRGKLLHPRNANSQLTLRGGMNVDAGGEHNMGEQGDPIQNGYTAELTLNFSSAPSVGKYRVNFNSNSKWKMWGQTKKRHTKLSATAAVSATTIYVTDATGWKPGDELYLASTANGTEDQQELATIHASYTPGSLTVPLVSALTKQHLNKCPVANLTSNVRYSSYRTGGTVYDGQVWGTSGTSNATGSMALGYCSLDGIAQFSGESTTKGLFISCDANYSQTPLPQAWAFTGVAFVCRGAASGGMMSIWNNAFPYASRIPFTSCAFVHSQGTGQMAGVQDAGFTGYWDCLFASASAYDNWGSISAYMDQPVFCGTIDYSATVLGRGRNVQIERAFYTGPSYGLAYSCGTGAGSGWEINNSDVAETFTARAGEPVVKIANAGTSVTLSMKNSHFGSYPIVNGAAAQKAMSGASYIKVINKNRDVTAQEEYYATGSVYRDNSVKNRSTSSLRIEPLVVGSTFSRSQEVNCANGASIRLVGYARRDTATSTAKVTISGLGITPVVFTLSAGVNTWQQFDLQAANSAGYDGAFTVTYENTDSASATSKAYFDGVPFSPFVTFARHYGFAFDEANPSRIVNPIATASESAAYAYTGVTINSATPQITVGAGTANTFRKVYDYIQAWACLNIDKAVLFTSTDGNNFAVPLTCKVSWPSMGNDGTLSGGWLLLSTPGTLNYKLSGTKIEFQTAGNYDMGGTAFGGTVEFVNSSGGAVTVAVPAGTSYTNTGPSITVTAPTVTQGLNFTGLVAGSQVVVFATGSQTELFRDNASATSETWSQAGGSDTTVDYTIFKDGYLPIRVTGITVNSAVVGVPVQQSVDPAYITPSGLTWGSTATVNVAGKTFAISAATTGQNWYSFMVQQWRQQATLQNVAFPLTTNGPNSVRLANGWEFSGGLSNWTRDGLAYFNTSGVRTATWAAVLTSGTTAGHQVRYLQSDGGTSADAANTGPMDQLVPVYGDASHGNFDRTGFLVVKIQKEGFDQAEADIYGTYGTLEDQLYVVGLQAIPNGVAASSTARTITITDSPVTWQSKTWSLTIDATGVSGTQLMQWLRYSFVQAGTFQSKPTFNWHDLVQTNGAKFKTVRGVIHGDASAALKGVRVLASGAAHPDFDTFTADDGTTYSPPVTQSFTVDGLVSGSYVRIYDVTNAVQLAIGTSTTSFVWVDSGAATGDRQIRIRVAYCSGASAKEFIEVANAGTCGTTVATANKTYTVAQVDDAVYNANAIAGSGVTGITISDAIDRMQINIAGGTVSWRSIYAYNVYWLSTAAGIVDDGSIITAKDQANYSVTLFKIKNTGATPLKITQGWGVDSVTGSVEDIIDTTGNNIYPVVDHVVSSVVSVGGANIITGDIADIPAAVLAAAVTTPIHANIQKVNDVIVNGTGATGDEWGP